MKVGILTWYDVLNYGSAFQAYALQESVKSLGCDVEILQHDRILPDYFSNKLKDKSIIGILKWFRNQTPSRSKNRHLTKRKYKKFERFRNEYLNVGSRFDECKDDCVLIGSDQIFDINGMYYPFQFGKGISCEKVGVYAPSFGETTYEKVRESDYYDEIVESINNLNFLNARDQNTQYILSQVTGKEIPITIDPVLLYDWEKEKEMWNDRLINEPYCIVYTWGGTTTSEKFAQKCCEFARKNNLKLVSVGEVRNWCDIQYADASPIEFFELFMYTDMILTNMFHGTCFSIIMEKPFYSFVMPHNENKLGGLLNFLGLQTQIAGNIDDLILEIPKINYSEINISQKRAESKNELLKCLNK